MWMLSALRFDSGIMNVFTSITVGTSSVRQQIAKDVYTHCLRSVGDSTWEQMTLLLVQEVLKSSVVGLYDIRDPVSQLQSSFTIDMELSVGVGTWDNQYPFETWMDFINDVVNYFQWSGIAVRTQELINLVLNNLVSKGNPSEKRDTHNNEARQSTDQVCATSIDVRQYFADDTSDLVNNTSTC